MNIEGVGSFKKGDGYWEAEPEHMSGATLSIESEVVTGEQEQRAIDICKHWDHYLQVCMRFIDTSREKYGLLAKQFFEPGAFVNEDDVWTIYFNTESEIESTVGVEFRLSEPFQLIIGG